MNLVESEKTLNCCQFNYTILIGLPNDRNSYFYLPQINSRVVEDGYGNPGFARVQILRREMLELREEVEGVLRMLGLQFLTEIDAVDVHVRHTDKQSINPIRVRHVQLKERNGN